MKNRKNKLIAFTPSAISVIESKKIEFGMTSATAVVNKIIEDQEVVKFLLFEKGTNKFIRVDAIINGVVFFYENGDKHMSAENFCKLDLYEDMKFTIPLNRKFFESKIE